MMVLEYYRLREQPFGVTPDSRYLVETPTHKDALASLIYGIEAGCGFVALIATPGLGKTTLLFETLHILREKARIVFLFQTISTPLDLLRALLSGLGVRDLQGSLVEMQIRLKELLIEQYNQGKRVVVVIDEAQNLDDSVLELVRMLSNFETARDKLIQIILAGQPQLAENIGSPELLQLRQRISIFATLKPLTQEETAAYITQRLRIAGYASDMPLFTKDALALIAGCSEGIPRNINNLCFNALSLGCALQQKPIDRDVVRQVIADLDLGPLRKRLPAPQLQEEKFISKAPAIFSQNSPALFSSQDERSGFAGWLPKVAAAVVIPLVIGGALFSSRQWLAGPAASHPAPLAAVPPAPRAAPSPTPAASDPPAPLDSEAQVPVKPEAPVPASSLPRDSAAPVSAVPGGQTNGGASPSTPAAPSAEVTSQSTDSVGIVQVSPGQTLLGICAEKFGNCTTQLLQQIHELNPRLSDPDHIETGQKIRVPVMAAQSSAGEQPRKTPSSEKSTHE
jgi:general secretion pathway protein A